MAAFQVWAFALLAFTGMISAQTETTTASTGDTPAAPTDGPTVPRFLRRRPLPDLGGGLLPPDFTGGLPDLGGPGGEGPLRAIMDAFLARVYPTGTPAEVTDLLAQRTPQAFRQALALVRQAAEAQGIQLPGPLSGPTGAGGPFGGPSGPGPLMDALLARVYPNGVPVEVTDLMAQGTPEALRQAMDIVRQAAEAQGIQLPRPFRGPPGAGGPGGPFGGPPGPLTDALLARVYPNGVPVEVTDLLAQGTFDAVRQAMDIVRQAAEAQGIQLPGPFSRPPGGSGPLSGPLGALTEGLLARVYPNGVPVEVTDLMAQGTPEALRQAMDVVRQAAEAQGIRLPRPFRGPRGPGGAGPFSGPVGPFSGPVGPLRERFLARLYPDGVPAEVSSLLEQGTAEARRQAMQLVGQAMRDRMAQRFSGGAQAGGPDSQANGGQGGQGGFRGGLRGAFQGGPFRGGFQRGQFRRGGRFGGNAGNAGDSGNGLLGGLMTGLRALQQG